MPELRDLAPPPPRRRFDGEVWDRLEAEQRATARRWRVLAVTAAALALAGTAAAGVLAVGRAGAVVVDRTLTCAAPHGKVQLFAHVKRPSVYVYEPGLPGRHKLVPHPALVELDAGRFVALNAGIVQVVQTTLAGAYAGAALTQKAGYTVDGSACLPAAPIPLVASGLRPAGASVYRECPAAGTATFRIRIALSKSGLPASAKLAVRAGKTRRPVAYVEWTPSHVRAWLARGCQQYTQLAP